MINIKEISIVISLLTIFFESSFAQTPVLNMDLSNFPPYTTMTHGKLTGINAEYITSLEKTSGMEFRYELYPHARMRKRLETGSAEAMLIFRSICDNFSHNYESLISVYSILPSIYLLKKTDEIKNDIRIGRVRGTCTLLLKENMKEENIVELDNMELGFRMMKAGRMDGVCANAPLLKYHNKQAKFEFKIFKTQKDSPDFKAVICVRKNLSTQIKKQLKEAGKKVSFIAEKLSSTKDSDL